MKKRYNEDNGYAHEWRQDENACPSVRTGIAEKEI